MKRRLEVWLWIVLLLFVFRTPIAHAAVTVINLASQVTGILGIANGGLNTSTVPSKTGQIPIYDSVQAKYVPGDPFITANTPAIVQKAHNNVGGTSVKTLATTVSATAAGNSLVVDVCAGSVANGTTIVLTMTDSGGSDVWTLAATQAVSTTFACSIYYSTNISAGNTSVTATFSGASSANTTIAMQVWEMSGLITLSPQVLDTTATGTATSTTLLAGQVQPNGPNEYAFAAFGVGTAAQTVTLTGTGTWNNDSGQINPSSASGLFSMVGASNWYPAVTPISAGGTITSEPWVAVLAVFRPVILPIQANINIPQSTSNFTTPVCTSSMTGTTSTVTVAAPTAGLHLYITSLSVSNSHATVDTNVTFQDGSGGTTVWNLPAAHLYGGAAPSFPVPLRLPTAGNGLYAANATTGAAVIACATGFTGP